MSKSHAIKAIDKTSIQRITSGQVVIDLQTAVKELLENSIDAGATKIEIRFKNYGLASIEVVDNGSGIAEEDYDSIALKHHTSKLETYTDLTTVKTFGFRGEALSSLCALSEELSVSTATSTTSPQGVTLTMDSHGKVKSKNTVARTQGTTITMTNLFKPLPVRRKEFERNVKREFGKALALLNAYAIGPCSEDPGIRLTVSNQPEKGSKSVQIRTLGEPSSRAAVSALWGPKSLDDIVDIDLTFEVESDRATLKRLQIQTMDPICVQVKGLISKFAPSCGRTGTDRQFFYVNGRPCNMNKVQKAFNEVYRSFNATQSPFILANFLIPTESYDVNVSPDKRTILLHSEGNLLTALKVALEEHFAPTRAMYDVGGGGSGTQGTTRTMIQTLLTQPQASSSIGIARGKAKHEHSQGRSSPANTQIPVSQSTTPVPPSPPILTRTSQCLDTSSHSQNLNGDSANNMSNDKEDMDLSRDSEANSQSEAITVNTLQTTWGRQIRSSPIPSPPTLPSLPDLDNDTVEPFTPPRKKRKSDLGAVITRRGSSVYAQTENDDLISKDVGHQTTTTNAVSSKGQNGSRMATPPNQAVLKTTHNLRKQLASFARTGGQLASSSSAAVHSEEEDGDNEDHDEEVLEEQGREVEGAEAEREEEVDELDPMQDDNIESQALETSQNERILKKKSSVIGSAYPPEPDTNPFESLGPETESFGHTNIHDEADDTEDPDSLLSQVHESSSATPSTISQKNKPPNPEVIKTDKDGGDVLMRFDVDRIKNVWSQKSQLKEARSARGEAAHASSVPIDAGISNTADDAKAVDALARVIEKQDFAGMDIVGQFNLGFIIIRRHQRSSMTFSLTSATGDETVLDDLFIVDQHAADEKYNFENLQATTKIESQKLLRPRPLELTASDEMLALENLGVLRQNGFDIDVDEDSPVDQGSRLKLVAQPVSKSTVFDMRDLEEIVHLMRDRPSGQMVRCSKARAMFASRACRKSVMVGMPLNQHQMTTVVRHMGTMDQPWNCPHGRPTMRHLSDIRATGSKAKEHIDWSSIY